MKSKTGSILFGLMTLYFLNTTAHIFAVEGAVPGDRVSVGQQIGLDLYVPIQKREQLKADLDAMNDPLSPNYRKWLTPAQFNTRYGATAKQLTAIQDAMATYGLVTSVVSGHHLHVTGSAGAVERALGAPLTNGVFRNGRATVNATREFARPDALVEVNAAVVGLSATIRMRTHAQITPMSARQVTNNGESATGLYWFTDLKQAYSFPSYLTYNGKGVTIATIVDGAYTPSDMAMYFGHEHLATPNITEINVDGGAPVKVDSMEGALDLEQAGGTAPGANLIHYNLPDLSDQSIIDGLSQILMDNKADVVSMSFGGSEIYYTAPYNDGTDLTYLLREEDDLMAQGNAQGITFIASSGDNGALSALPLSCIASPYTPDCGAMVASVNFPASSPHVTAVGGTNLVTSHDGVTRNSTYVSEQAYPDLLTHDIFLGTTSSNNIWASGGGNSIVFAKPSYQYLVKTGNASYRTVPDVALHMGGCYIGGAQLPCNAGDSSDYMVYNGTYYEAIGTSASAPDFAGLTALLNQRTGGRIGNANTYIYSLALLQNAGLPVKVFRTNIPGSNGLYTTTPTGYNRVLGNGTLNGINFLLAPMPVAGIPLTPSNP